MLMTTPLFVLQVTLNPKRIPTWDKFLSAATDAVNPTTGPVRKVCQPWANLRLARSMTWRQTLDRTQTAAHVHQYLMSRHQLQVYVLGSFARVSTLDELQSDFAYVCCGGEPVKKLGAVFHALFGCGGKQ
jgi:doublecortin